MRRNNKAWEPPDYRSAVRGSGNPDASSVTRRPSQGQVPGNGEHGQERLGEALDQMVREDRVKTASDKQKMFRNTMQLMQRRKTASKGNIVTFMFNERNGFIDKKNVMNNVLQVSGFKPSDVLSVKMNDFRGNECEVMFKEEVKVDCEDIEDKIKKKGFNVTVGKFIETEEICMVYGLPLTSDVDWMKEQIRETISPFVRRVVSITATTHYGKNENDFFHGRLTGDYKVKVVPLKDGQIPNYVSIGEEHVMGRVHYVRKMIEKKVMCDACYSTEHMMRSPECPGVVDWLDYVRQYEGVRDMAIRNFEVSSSCPAPAPSFVTRNADIKRLSEEVVDLQAKNLALEAEKVESCKKFDDLMARMRMGMANGENMDLSESSFTSTMGEEDPLDTSEKEVVMASSETSGKEVAVASSKTSGKEVVVGGEKRRASDVSKLSELTKGETIWWKSSKKDFVGVFLRMEDPLGTVLVEVKNKKGEVSQRSVSLTKCPWGTMSNN